MNEIQEIIEEIMNERGLMNEIEIHDFIVVDLGLDVSVTAFRWAFKKAVARRNNRPLHVGFKYQPGLVLPDDVWEDWKPKPRK